MTTVQQQTPEVQRRAEELAEFGLPDRLIEHARQFGEMVLGFNVELSDAFELTDEYADARAEIMDDSESLVLDELVKDGVITTLEASIISKVSKSIAERYRIFEDPQEEDADDKYPLTLLARELINFNAAEDPRFNREDRRGFVDPDVNRFVRLAENIASRGQYLRPATRAQKVVKARVTDPTYVGADGDERRYFGIEDPDVLVTMALVDVFTFAYKVPDEMFLRQAKYGDDANYTRNLNIAGLTSSLEDKNAFTGIVEYLFKGQPRRFISRRLKGENEGLYTEAFSVRQQMLGVTAFTRQRLEAQENFLGRMIRTFDEASDGVKRKIDQVEASLQELASEVHAYISQDPTPERVLGGLAIENWVEALMFEYDQEAAKRGRARGDKPIHDAIEDEDLRLQLLEIDAKLQPAFEAIAGIEEKYLISAPAIRALGGLDLRHAIESWLEPGSNRTVFNRGQAQQIAGLALRMIADPELASVFRKDYGDLKQAWMDVAFLQAARPRAGLMRDLDSIKEWYESAPEKMLNNTQLQPVWQLAKLLVSADADKPEQGDESDPQAGWKIPAEFEHVELIEAFPPGVDPHMVGDLEKISRDWSGDPIEWTRLESLSTLRAELMQAGYTVTAHRLMQSSWHPLPHYVLEVSSDGKNTVAVVESPIYGNATYIIPDTDWRDIVQFTKEEVRAEFNGIAKVHSAATGPSEHRQKIKNVVLLSVG